MAELRAGLLAAALLVGAALPGCAAPGGDELVVFAASSTRAVFERLGERFEADHQVAVRFSFAASDQLADQIAAGAPADVFAAADRVAMSGLAGGDEATAFATNRLVIATLADGPTRVSGLADLAREEMAVVVCAPRAPCGRATAALIERAGVRLAPVSEEQSVADVAAKVLAGEADAGVVFASDVASRPGLAATPIEGAEEAEVECPIAVAPGARRPDLAAEFVALTLGPVGQAELATGGFGPPPGDAVGAQR